ncbi:MAG: class I SAM-dependent methyltransferase [Acidobacteria bacterium]|nr:class I SAM-dependent methyltransferase [Acidobacteriota bacterium]
MGHTCPWWFGCFLVNPIRRLAQRPSRILGPFVRPGMTVVEPGCGMGYFTLELARLVGPAGRVVAVDLQERMLAGLRSRAGASGLADRIETRLATPETLGISDLVGRVDLVLAFYVVHEIRDQSGFFAQVRDALTPDGTLLVVEPPLHVSGVAFEASLACAGNARLQVVSRPRIGANRAVVLVNPTA